MSVFIDGMTASELLEVFKLARIGANNCMIGHRTVIRQLPDHGDLIDREEVRKVFTRLADDPWNANAPTTWSKAYGYAEEILDEAPVVILKEVYKWQEPEINPCRGCEDYDGNGGCKSSGGCAERSEENGKEERNG